MRLQLMVDSAEFMRGVRSDIADARQCVFVQAMTFEGDAAGRSVAECVLASRAPDRRVAVDSYTRFNINDTWVFSPRGWFDRAFRCELRATKLMMRDLRARGVGVRFTNPMGFMLGRAAARNHKKLVLIDRRVAYIGGINFSDHNFAWRDVMLRIEDPDIVTFLADDFECTWRGENRAMARAFPGVSVYTLDGPHNATLFEAVANLVRDARERVDVHCCYLTPPFTTWLRDARARGVAVRIIVPAENNWPDINHHARRTLAAAGAEVLHYTDRMTHLKTMVIDDRVLLVGSANFDFLSYRLHQEFLAVVTDPAVVRDYRDRVLDPDARASAVPMPSRAVWREAVGHARIRMLEQLSRWMYPSVRADVTVESR